MYLKSGNFSTRFFLSSILLLSTIHYLHFLYINLEFVCFQVICKFRFLFLPVEDFVMVLIYVTGSGKSRLMAREKRVHSLGTPLCSSTQCYTGFPVSTLLRELLLIFSFSFTSKCVCVCFVDMNKAYKKFELFLMSGMIPSHQPQGLERTWYVRVKSVHHSISIFYPIVSSVFIVFAAVLSCFRFQASEQQFVFF